MTDIPPSSPEEVLAEGEVQERRDALRRTVQEAFAAEDLSTLRLVLNDQYPVLALSFFVPAVMAMGGNTGIQTATVTVRSLAIGQGQWGLVGRELRVALGLGIIYLTAQVKT